MNFRLVANGFFDAGKQNFSGPRQERGGEETEWQGRGKSGLCKGENVRSSNSPVLMGGSGYARLLGRGRVRLDLCRFAILIENHNRLASIGIMDGLLLGSIAAIGHSHADGKI